MYGLSKDNTYIQEQKMPISVIYWKYPDLVLLNYGEARI